MPRPITSRLTGVLAALVASVLLVGCGSDAEEPSSAQAGSDDPAVLSRQLVEQEVRKQLAEEVGREPEQVTCPGDLTGVVDQQMRCMLADAGVELGVTLTVTSVDDDGIVRFDVAVDDTES